MPSKRRQVQIHAFETLLFVKPGAALSQVLCGPQQKAALLRAALRLAAQVRNQQAGLCDSALRKQPSMHAHCKGYAFTCRQHILSPGHVEACLVLGSLQAHR